ncbi:MAG: glycine-rich domain-containing protein [Kiritimatiellia bacterium]
MKSITLSAMNLLCVWVLLAGTAHGGHLLAVGGTETNIVLQDGKYRVHSFTNNGMLTVTNGGALEYLIVGGGGGTTRARNGGGGGAGKVVCNTGSLIRIDSGVYSIVVGAGGTATGANGEESNAFGISAPGGAGTAGGPIGGTSGNGYAGGSPIPAGDGPGAGGGGASEKGHDANDKGGGDGGNGIIINITGITNAFGGGGGGGRYGDYGLRGNGGLGGGGTGGWGANANVDPTSGAPNTGGGAGGAGQGSRRGGAGGSGIVIVRYKLGVYSRPVANVTSNKATFNAWLASAGNPPAVVNVLWGENNGAESGVWAHTNVWKTGAWKENSYPSLEMAKLTPDRTYFYAFGLLDAKTNEVADHPVSFITGALAVRVTKRESTEDAPAEFLITRPATAVSAPLEVNFTLGGTGINGTDYEQLDCPAIIPAGKSELRLRVNPKFNFGDQRPKSVELTLAPGGYVVGTKRNATILTRAE